MELQTSYIMLTISPQRACFKKKADGNFEKSSDRIRPGTERICAAIMNKLRTMKDSPSLSAGALGVKKQKMH